MKQGQNFFKFKSQPRALNQQGQAVVEYILLLVVIISMLMATKGLFAGANKFIDDYVGKYFICLMDYGELPKLGNSDSDLIKHSSGGNPCAAKFTVAGGASLTGGSTGGSTSTNGKDSTSKIAGGKDSSSSSSSKGGSDSSKNSKGKNGSSGSDSDSLGNGSNGGAGNSNYANGRIQRSRSSGTSDGPNDNGSNKTKIIEDEQAGGSRNRFDDNGRSGNKTEYKYNRYKAITSGQMFDEIEKKSAREVRKSEPKVVSKAAEEGFRPGPRKNAFIPQERKIANIEDDKETNFGFGAMMKWLMIAGMVVAIIVFFGGQIMNYSNSD